MSRKMPEAFFASRPAAAGGLAKPDPVANDTTGVLQGVSKVVTVDALFLRHCGSSLHQAVLLQAGDEFLPDRSF